VVHAAPFDAPPVQVPVPPAVVAEHCGHAPMKTFALMVAEPVIAPVWTLAVPVTPGGGNWMSAHAASVLAS
jgi:hypothetical protein